MTTRDRSAPSASKTSSWSSPTVDWTAWVVIASPVRRAARAAARWTRSSWAESHGLSVPISPMIPARIPVSPTPSVASRTISSASGVDRAAIDQRLGRVVGAAVPAGAHDDVESGRPGEPGEPRRVAPDAVERQVDDASRRRPPGTRRAPRRSRARRGAAPSSPSGSGCARARSRCARGAGPSRASAGSIGPRTVWTRPRAGVGHEAARPARGPTRTGGAGPARSARGGAASRRGEERLDQGEDPPLGVGPAVAGAVLGRLDEDPVEQRRERMPDRRDVEPGRQLAAHHALLEDEDDRRDGLAPATEEHLPDRRVRVGLGPGLEDAGSRSRAPDCSTARLSNQ